MFCLIRLYFVFLVATLSLFAESQIQSYITSENDSFSILNGFVNAYNGKVIQIEKEIVVDGPDPLEFVRYYDGGHHAPSEIGYGMGYNFPIKFQFNYYQWKNVVIETRIGNKLPYRLKSLDKKTITGSIDPIVFKMGYTNSSHASLMGEPSVLSTKVTWADDTYIVTLGDGTKRYYQLYLQQFDNTQNYRIIREEKPNGTVRHFSYCQKHSPRLLRIWTTNKKGTLTLNWLEFSYDDFSAMVTASNGQKVTYTIETKKCSTAYNYKATKSALSEVNAEHLVKNSFQYITRSHFINSLFSLEKVTFSNGSSISVDYNSEEKVKRIFSPISDTPIYTLDYGKSRTTVQDALGAKREYTFSGRRLKSLDLEYRSHHFNWDDHGQLVEEVQKDPQGVPLITKQYKYDDAGNLIEAKVLAKITNDNASDCYTVGYGYVNNLLIKERYQNGVTYTYAYHPGTNLKTEKLTFHHNSCVKREFFEYDDNGILICSIKDDGSSNDKNNLSDVTYRTITDITPYLNPNQPGMTLPHWIKEWHVSSSGKRWLTNAKELFYTQGDLVAMEKIYDASLSLKATKGYEYNNKRQLVKDVNELGETTFYRYDDNFNKIYEEKLGSGKKTLFAYDLENRLIEEREIHQGTTERITRHRYDLLGNRTQTINHFGKTSLFTYNKFGQKIAETDPMGKTKRWEYDPLGRPTLEVDEEGYETKTKYNLYGAPLRIDYPDGSFKTCEYNLDGHLIKELDRDGTQTIYTLDPEGHQLITKIVDSHGNLVKETKKTYKGDLCTTETDGRGYVTYFFYDGAGRKIGEEKEGITTSFGYDSLGRHVRTQTGQKVTIKILDLLDRVIEERVEDDTGKIFAKVQFAYDVNGNQVRKKVFSNQSDFAEWQFAYNSKNQLILEIDPIGNHTSYFHEETTHYKKLTTNALGRLFVEGFDANERLKWTQNYDAGGRLIAESFYNYDGRGLQVLNEEKIYEGNQPIGTFCIETDYDAMGQVICLNEQKAKETSYSYKKGHLDIITQPNGTKLTHTWDALGRLIELKASDNTIHQRFSYDPEDNLIEANDCIQNNTVLRSYDPFNRLIHEKQATSDSITLTWDAMGNLHTLTTPHQTIKYVFSPTHFVSAANITWECNWLGKPTQMDLMNCVPVSLIWDELGRLQEMTSPYHCLTLHYNALGSLDQSSGFDLHGPFVNQYHYGPLNQLIKEDGDVVKTYSYDSIQNRRLQDTTRHTINKLNQVTDDGTCSYIYDPRGFRVAKDQDIYTYDALGRLLAYKDITYTYDALGRRIARTEGGAREESLYFFEHEIALSQNGQVHTSRIIHPVGYTLAIQKNQNFYSCICNHRGDITLLLNSDGNIEETLRYDAFGNGTPSTVTPWTFTGHRFDSATKLYHFDKRDYDPALGRWLTPDPLHHIDGANTYAYVKNSPLIYVDPYGLWYEEAKDFGHGFWRGFCDDTTFGATSYGLGEFECKNGWNTGGYGTGTAVSMAASCFYGGIFGKVAGAAGRGFTAYRVARGVSAEVKVVKAANKTIKIANTSDKCVRGAAKTTVIAEKTGITATEKGILNGKSIWTTGKYETGVENAFAHWVKHGREFPDIVNSSQFVRNAHSFFRNPKVLQRVRSDGIHLRYDPLTNIFGSFTKDGVPKTFFKPDPSKIKNYKTSLEYFHGQ